MRRAKKPPISARMLAVRKASWNAGTRDAPVACPTGERTESTVASTATPRAEAIRCCVFRMAEARPVSAGAMRASARLVRHDHARHRAAQQVHEDADDPEVGVRVDEQQARHEQG